MAVRGRTVIGVLAGGVCAAALAAALLPTAVERIGNRHQESAHYPSGSAAKAARVSVPRWLPDGATGVSYLMSTTGADRLLRATVPGGRVPAGCTEAAPDGAARLSAAWFPHEMADRGTARCGQWNITLVGDQLYGWQDDRVVVAARKTGTSTE